jgi:two-component system, response regulator YesN
VYRVLLVDDEPFILEGLKYVVDWEKYGFEIVDEATSGAAALEMINAQTYHLLVTDIKMPDMSGLQLMRQIKQAGISMKTVILSGYDDFAYVKEGMKLGIENYLLKPVNEEELSLTLLNIAEKLDDERNCINRYGTEANILKGNILYRWVTGSIGEAELKERGYLLDIDLSSPYYMVCLIRIMASIDLCNVGMQGKEQPEPGAAGAINQICDRVIAGRYRYDMVDGFYNDLILLLHLDDKDTRMELLQDMLNDLLHNIRSGLHLNALITRGSLQHDFMSVGASYYEALDLMENGPAMLTDGIINFTTYRDGASDIRKHLDFHYNKMKSAIGSRNLEQTLNEIDMIFSRAKDDGEHIPSWLRNVSADILFTLISGPSSANESISDQFFNTENRFSRIFEIHSLSELRNWIRSIATNRLNDTSKSSGSRSPIITRMLEYINKNYDKDISLKTISVIFNMNPSYLGQLFKKEVSESFSNHLNYIRIEKARNLLLNSRLSAAQVGEKIGYTNPGYFYMTFKKYTGQYPTQYKRNNSI